MARTRFVVTLPDHAWVTPISRENPDATFRLLAAVGGGESVAGLFWITASNVPAILESMDATGIEPTILHRTDQEAAVQFETADAVLLTAAVEARIPILLPIETSAGRATLDAVGDPVRITALARQLEATCADVTIEFVREQFDSSWHLTHRQRTLVVTALEMGYYDTPRRCSLTDLADELGLAKSTLSETLHRAEEAIVKEYFRATERPPAPL